MYSVYSVVRKSARKKTATLAGAGLAFLVLTAGLTSRAYADDAPRAVTPSISPGAELMLRLAVRAVNLHRPDALAPFAASGGAEAFAWAASKNHVWKADVLPVPGDPAQAPRCLAVFHTFHTCESDGDHVFSLVQAAANGGPAWKLGAEIPETDTLGLRIRDHNIDAGIDVASKTATFRDTIDVERTKDPGAAETSGFGLLRLNEDYRVRSLRVSGTGDALTYSQAGGVVAFVPPAADRFALSLEYSGRLDHSNGDFIHDDEAVIASYWYPHIARLPATLSLTATAPAGWTPIGQGEPTATHIGANGAQTISWRNDIPTSYFTLDMGRYHITSRQWNGRLLSAYLLEADANAADKRGRRSLDLLQQSLAFYEKTFGPFPYHRYAVVETRGPFNGALEAYSFATFGPRTLPEFIPHELSHTWWGGLVPCTYTRSMWNEAFANYSDDLFQRIGKPHENGLDMSAAMAAARLEVRKQVARSYSAMPVARAFDTDDDPHNAVGYGKGAQVLRVLEEQIGQAAMLTAMRAFVSRHVRGEAAEWPEFEAAVEQTTGQDLHWFFAQWLDRTGTPSVTLSDVRVRSAGSETWVEGRIRQAGPVYRMKLPVTVDLRSGATVRQTVETQEADTSFRIRVSGSPDRLRLDPEAIIPMSSGAMAQAKSDPFSYAFP